MSCRSVILPMAVILVAGCHPSARTKPADVRFTMTDDGGWCWFQDERAIVDGDLLVVGSVATGHQDPQRAGNIEIHWRNLVTGDSGTSVLHGQLEKDDHDVPALLVLPDGRILAAYSRHGHDRLVRMRRSMLPGTAAAWGPETTVEVGLEASGGVTYSNLHMIENEKGQLRLYDFYRGEGWDPNAIESRDGGNTWKPVGGIMSGPGRPYLKYASDGSRVHFIATEQHPRDADNSLWHGYYQDGRLYSSDGTIVGILSSESPPPNDYTRVFEGGPGAVAWPADLAMDRWGDPVAVYTVQVDGADKPRGRGGRDHRFRYARWTGESWLDYEMGHAGRRLYPGEDDYTGLAAIDPFDPRVVYVSTDAHPGTGEPVITESDGVRRREIFQGRGWNGGRTWEWKALTSQSSADNLRPIAVSWGDGEDARTILLWLHGTMKSYTDYAFEVRGLVLERSAAAGSLEPDP